jgi:putative ABC transport system permease protein
MTAISESGQVPDVAEVTADFQASANVGRNGKDVRVQVFAAMPNYYQVRNWAPTMGSFFSQTDLDERQRVLLLGSDIAAELFPNEEYPVDQTVQVNGLNFRVIGVMESKGGGPGGNLDNTVFIPLTTAQDRIFARRRSTANTRSRLSTPR